MPTVTEPRRGFTLIELLIVVAIIAILAAIAVPNFLEAQVRSKVSRVKNDHRTIATAMEAYFVDWNSYTRDHDNRPPDPLIPLLQQEAGIWQLTTPVAYLTTPATDPFSDQIIASRPNDSNIALYYEMGCGSDNNRANLPITHAYMLISLGPNKKDETNGNDEWPSEGRVLFYDPTNGSVSDGDVYRFGGAYRSGAWFVGSSPSIQLPYTAFGFGDVP